MEIKVEKKSGILDVSIVGRLVASCSDELTERLSSELESCPNVLFDLSQMTHIDSSGLGVLVRILQKCKEAGGACRIACLQPHPRIVFDITKVHRVIEIFDTVEEALQAFA